MRLSDEARRIIREEAQHHFGPEVEVRLFGSRVIDRARGGDIDLHIEAEGSADELLHKELAYYAALIRRLGERRIDLVLHARGTQGRPIDLEAHASGVLL